MRRRLPTPNGYTFASLSKHTPFFLQSSSHFSSASGSGRGRGRGGGDGIDAVPSPFDFTPAPGKPSESDGLKSDWPESVPVGHGRGRGIPNKPDPVLPSFTSFVAVPGAGRGRGRGRGGAESAQPSQSPTTQWLPGSVPPPPPSPKSPIFVKLQDIDDDNEVTRSREANLPTNVLSALSGRGRGKPNRDTGPARVEENRNRYIQRPPQFMQQQPPQAGQQQPSQQQQPQQQQPQQVAQQQQPQQVAQQQQQPPHDDEGESVEAATPRKPKLSREEAVAKALGVLSRGGSAGAGRGGESEASGMRGRGGRGRGRGREGWRGGGRGGRGGRGRREREEDNTPTLYLGDNADGERLAQTLGPEGMNELTEAFEEITERVLPCPLDEEYIQAMDTNYSIEFEPEFLMEEFGTNPDIDDKAPMPLRDALEKAKPFVMMYDGIQNEEEWEEAVEEAMSRVPVWKELLEHYSGPDRVTAKQQQGELERVAKTLPQSAPASVKRFTDRALLSLQSNPGWGFDKKCQFMDKLVWEVSQHYK